MKRLTKLIISLTMLVVMAFSLTGCGKSVLVTLDATGGYVSAITIELKTKDDYTLPKPIREGYDFVCWLDGEKEIPNQGVWSIEKEVTLKAKWSVKSYDITLDANEGEVDITNLNVTFDKEVTLPTPTRKGYTFKGWQYEGKTITDSVWKIDGENIKLIAKWEIINYVVTFKLNGGQFSGGYENKETTTVNYGKDYDFRKFNPTNPDNIELLYWVLEDGTRVDSVGKWKYDRDVTLTAVWKDGWLPPLPV